MFPKIAYWVQHYGGAEISDQRSVQDFMECEPREAVASLKNDLVLLSQGVPDESALDPIIGLKRKLRHNSYQEWAKMMLLWMASYKS